MNRRIGQDDMARMFAAAAERIREQHAALSALDCATGDGDHGSTMLRVVDQLDRAVAPAQGADLKTMLGDAGWRILGVDGGASSSLLGAFFLGMADGPAPAGDPGAALGCRELTATFEAGLAAVSKQTKAQPGDKTMMDALIPAIAALHAAAESGLGVSDAMREAARAARAGAESTRDLTARYGRAKFLGEKTRGYQDPGAASVALLFEGFSAALLESKGDVGNA